jgi:hypothetical protein
MSKKSKFVIATAIAVLGLTSQAFARGGGHGAAVLEVCARPVDFIRRRSSVPRRPSSTHQRRFSLRRSRTPYRSRAKLQSRQQVRVPYLATAKTEKAMSKKPKLLIVAAMIAVLGSSSQALARGGTFHLNSYYEQAENR